MMPAKLGPCLRRDDVVVRRDDVVGYCFVLPHGKNHVIGFSTRSAHDASLCLAPGAV